MSFADIYPSPHVIEPQTAHTHTVIFLHGRASDGEEFAEEFAENKTSLDKTVLEHVEDKACKWIFPSAHERWSTLFEEELTEWFDIRSLSNPDEEQENQVAGIKESIEYINTLIDKELATTPAGNIILGGISQGFAVAIHVLLTRAETFGGFIGMSGWAPFRQQLQDAADQSEKPAALSDMYRSSLDTSAATTNATMKTPIWMSHSADDNIVEIEQGKAARDVLLKLGFDVDFHEYEDGQHWLQSPAGHDDLVKFITARL